MRSTKNISVSYYGLVWMIIVCACASLAQAQELIIDKPYNEYAAAFRETDQGLELWITISDDNDRERNRSLARYRFNGDNLGEALPLPAPLNRYDDAERDTIVMDGAPAFNLYDHCHGEFGLFVSNRRYQGQFYDNDIYEMRRKGDDWIIARQDNLCTKYWDDTPALNVTGDTLFFSSDRVLSGKRKADIYFSVRCRSDWSDPVRVASISTEAYSEEAPYVGPDGYLYFASNRSGDYDIWRVRLAEVHNPTARAERFAMAGVNQTGSHETHPAFSPSGDWFAFSTNRGPDETTKDFGIVVKYAKTPHPRIGLKVRLMTREEQKYGGASEDKAIPIQTNITIYDSARDYTSIIVTDEHGFAQFDPPSVSESSPGRDVHGRTFIISAESPSPRYVSSIDTLEINMLSKDTVIDHTLYLWDTTAYYDKKCTYEFPVKKVRFFVNAYWCPTTEKYRYATPCRSMIMEEYCKVSPNPPCESNELYVYEVEYVYGNSKTTVIGNCIDYNDFERNKDTYLPEVDKAIDKLQDEMRAVFGVPCVQRAIRDNKQIRVEVIGFTDPNTLDKRCRYIGEEICFGDSTIAIAGAAFPIRFSERNRKWYPDNCIPQGYVFRKTPSGGNLLLSDVRGIYTSILLDRLWSDNIPNYRELRNRGLLFVETWGEAISREEAQYARKRSVVVRVSVPTMEQEPRPGRLAPPGQRVVICHPEPCKPCTDLALGR